MTAKDPVPRTFLRDPDVGIVTQVLAPLLTNEAFARALISDMLLMATLTVMFPSLPIRLCRGQRCC